jgi:hypothetical protein
MSEIKVKKANLCVQRRSFYLAALQKNLIAEVDGSRIRTVTRRKSVAGPLPRQTCPPGGPDGANAATGGLADLTYCKR